MSMHTTAKKKNDGYILLLAVLISSIILAISFGIYALSIKEIILASYLKDSAKAFAVADRGMECTLYWDRSYPQNGMPYSIFATSTYYEMPWDFDPALYSVDSVTCEGIKIATSDGNWQTNNTVGSGETTFQIDYDDNTCAKITVGKDLLGGTTFISEGYNKACDDLANTRAINRTIQVTSNI